MQNNNPIIEKTERAIDKYKQVVYGVALTHLRYRADADDVFQEVFLLYFNKAIVFSDDEHEKAWLIRTTINLCKKSNASIWHTRTISLEDENYSLENILFETPEENTLFTELTALSPKYRIVLYLRYFENMPLNDIAHILKIRPDAVRKRISRGRAMLKERLERDYFE